MIPNASEMPAAILWRLITRLISVRPVWTCVLFKAMNPLVLDVLPLTLEEVFIHELGGDDNAINGLLF